MPRFKWIKRVLALVVPTLIVAGFPAAAQDADDMEPDQPGSEQILNAQLWEYMTHTPYTEAMLRVAKAKPEVSQELSLPTGWKVSPVGTQLEVGRFPSEAVSFAGRIVVLNAGYYSAGSEDPEVSVLEGTKVERTFRLKSLFPSAVASADGDLYISGGSGKLVYRLNRSFDTIRTYAIDGYVGGIAAIDPSHIAVASLVTAATETDFAHGAFQTGRVTILNTATGVVEHSVNTGYFPYAIAVDSGKLYVTELGENAVSVFDAASLKQVKTIPVGDKPQNITSERGKLYVVNTGSDSISVISSTNDKVVSTFKVGGFRHGEAPISCAADPAHHQLYVALANANRVEVLDSEAGRRAGAIPAGWYPTKVLLTDDDLIILNGKGVRARRPNPNGPQPVAGGGGPAYVLTLLKGSAQLVSRGEIPDRLADWTRAAGGESPVTGPVKSARQQIKHIFYIVRENRTYDQVMGDMPRANGDAALTLFGKEITPNGHSIASEFVTLDNYFADGEISVLGHSFTTSGYASPFLEWLAMADYSGRYNGYPFGMVPAVTSPTYLWDALDGKKLDYRVYGENYYLYTRAYAILAGLLGANSEPARKFYVQMMRLSGAVDRGAAFYAFASPYYGRADTMPDAHALLADQQFVTQFSHFLCGDDTLKLIIATREDVRKAFAALLVHYPSNYRSWDLKYSDLDRARMWRTDFEKLVKSGHVPSLEYLWLPNDHTGGTNRAYLPPDQLVAENDAALGLILQTISHSPVWNQSLVLVTEDDAQNGPDHVDATRTVALAAGPNVRRGAVVSDRFDQLSLLRTIGLILGFPPLNQNDALAVPMFSIFAAKPNDRPYNALLPPHLAADDIARYKSLNELQ